MGRIQRALTPFILFLFLTPGTSFGESLRCSNETPLASQNGSVWLHATHKPTKGVTIVAHGLNNDPKRMDAIAKSLNEDGYDVLRVALTGHRGKVEEFKSVTREKWLRDMDLAYCEAKRAADDAKIPLDFVGYSLGALVNLDLMNTHPEVDVKYNRMVLFAPAAAVKTTSYLVKILDIFGDGFIVPSLNNRNYRASCEGTPMAAYDALFDSIDHLQKSGIQRRNDIPTLIIMDPKDELVSESGLREMIDLNQLTNWKLTEVTKGRTELSGNSHHLIIDEASLGSSEWKFVQDAMRAHLDGSPLPSLDL